MYLGPGWTTDALVVVSLKGVLGSLDVRRALSLALNRQGIINSVYEGAAQLPRWLSNPGTFGYGTAVFARAYDSSPVLTPEHRGGQEAGQAGRGHREDDHHRHHQPAGSVRGDTGAYQAAAQAIGLKVALKAVSAQEYIDFFTEPKFRAGVDCIPGVAFGDSGDPASLLAQVVLPGGLQNFDGFSDPAITAALEQARSTANPDRRAALVAEAEKLAAQQLPSIPTVEPDTVLVLGKGLTGAVASSAYLFAPWANQLGEAG